MNTKKPITIAIDGFSSTGKSSIAKAIAKELGFLHIDSGAMYRGVTLFGLENCFDHQKNKIDELALIEKLPEINLDFTLETETKALLLNGKNVEKEIRSIEISNLVSSIAKMKEVRSFLVQKQRELAQNHSIVMDGRDIGTVVFPNADFKFFITAELKERAIRRWKDMKLQNEDITLEEIETNLNERDFVDVNRENSPLLRAKDAIEIDNTFTTKEETIQKILNIIQSD